MLDGLAELLKQVTGYIYPNEIELHWGILIVVYPYLTGLVAGAFILASLEQVFNVKEVQPTYRLSLLTALAFLIDRAAAAAAAPGPPGALLRDLPDARTSPRRWRCSASSTPGT